MNPQGDNMKLYLVQHGIANPEETDPEKHLSDEGKAQTDKVAASIKITPSKICHSSKTRAIETAAILAEKLGAPTEQVDGIAPMDDPQIWADKVEDGLMLVGHLPYLSKLCSLLVCGDAEANVIAFKNSGVVCLEKEDSWSVSWIITPSIL